MGHDFHECVEISRRCKMVGPRSSVLSSGSVFLDRKRRLSMGCCESIMRAMMGSSGGSGRHGKSELELGDSACSSKPFTMHATMRARDVNVQGDKVSGNGLALGCAPVEQVSLIDKE